LTFWVLRSSVDVAEEEERQKEAERIEKERLAKKEKTKKADLDDDAGWRIDGQAAEEHQHRQTSVV
jgi:hypothetical protein